MFHGRSEIGQQILGGVDLAIDLATLGEYGLEPLSADGTRCERPGHRPGGRRPEREALAAARRGACGRQRRQGAAARRSPDWEFRFPGAESGRPVDFRGAVARYAA